ncbi:metallophosphoesterase family protein [Methylobacterium sp. E-025]|jgi:calcineurin-like phosphoesterase family protein|uniref:metallophosphoesterase family protein n=1 Tax=unclassified Methylobacterium TaxID=2615210 RepID=UPI001FBB6D57|nr:MULTISPECIES: metallophosphoesterase family protein [unclassified Methylobacterium]MCJ2039884.1 metallophosphoesterase family protein [Methylobacterium sp. J-059]MCJ2110607.1 metallophosphoesterase family protein [Methylobacterium sp. E-025]
MKTFFTADTHFGHKGVLAMSGRPFASIEEHDEALIAAWNCVVGPRDEVWHLGDFAMGSTPERCAAVFKRLRGRKCLVRGNHDRKRTLDLPWHEQHDILSRKIEGQRIIACHYPMRAWPGAWRGSLQLFGHTHGMLPDTSQSCDVGVDRWAYGPTTLEEIRARLAVTPTIPEERLLGQPEETDDGEE